MKHSIFYIFSFLLLSLSAGSCSRPKEHTAPAVSDSDSAAVMTTYGVNMLISDSGVIKYRLFAERSVANQKINPPRTTFDKGIFMTQFDESFHVQAYIQADTAYRYDTQRIFELRGRVRILTKEGVRFSGEELFWDQSKREYYSNKYSYFETPERTLEGQYFRSDENMQKYYVSNSKGSFEQSDIMGDSQADDAPSADDTLQIMPRQPEMPRSKR